MRPLSRQTTLTFATIVLLGACKPSDPTGSTGTGGDTSSSTHASSGTGASTSSGTGGASTSSGTGAATSSSGTGASTSSGTGGSSSSSSGTGGGGEGTMPCVSDGDCGGGSTCQDYDCDGFMHCSSPGQGGPPNCCIDDNSCGGGLECCPPAMGASTQSCGAPGSCGTCPPEVTAAPPCTVGPCDAADHAPAASVDACVGTPSGVVSDCFFYLKLANCYASTSNECSTVRYYGYYQTCRNMGQVADGSSPDLPAQFASCIDDCNFSDYVSGMRSCLQHATRNYILQNKNALTGDQVVEGTGDPLTGIIGAHTGCNAKMGFCTKLDAHGRTCFGYALGNSWGPVCPAGGGFTPGGSFTSVGMCHFISEVLSCVQMGLSAGDFLDQVCAGYQQGCLNTDPCNDASLEDIGCKLACPTTADLGDLATFFQFYPGAQGIRTFLKQLSTLVSSPSTVNVQTLEATCDNLIGREQPGCHLNDAWQPSTTP